MTSIRLLRTALEDERRQQQQQHDFLQYSPTFHQAALCSAKHYLDPVIENTWEVKRRRYNALNAVYVDGFDVDQVWEQVNLLVNALNGKIPTSFTDFGTFKSKGNPTSQDKKEVNDQGGNDGVEQMCGSFEFDEQERPTTDAEHDTEGSVNSRGTDDEDLGRESNEEDILEQVSRSQTFSSNVHGLNDGFFSIDDFNRETEQFEVADMNGFPPPSDDESVDWNADPDVGGMSETEDDDNNDEEAENSNKVMYKDFFAPPARKARESIPRSRNPTSNELNEFSRITSDMERVRRDLFDNETSDDGEVVDEKTSTKTSSHTQRQATLVEQIRQLENANIAKRDWTLSGEAKASQRPLNSLLEEDLDFERAGKPVPIITQDVTDSLEEIIKKRILAEDFNEVVRRRPDDIKSSFRRGRMELDDSKSQRSLAEIYEEEHLRAINPENHTEAGDLKLQGQHKEIELLFDSLTRKLDALSSWHYTPKPAKPSLSVITDSRTIDMEETRATAASSGTSMSNTSHLAPQEVYRPGNDLKAHLKATGEIISRTGEVIAAREMTSDEKKRRRGREKERKRKSENNAELKKGKDGSKKSLVDSLRRSGVTVIGKHGVRVDVDGNVVKEKKITSGTSFML